METVKEYGEKNGITGIYEILNRMSEDTDSLTPEQIRAMTMVMVELSAPDLW
jgi:hypothetical protein